MENDDSLSENDVSIERRVGRRVRRNLPRIRSWTLLGIAIGCVSTALARLPGFSEISILGLIKWSALLLTSISIVGVLWLFVCEWLAEQKRYEIGPEATDATASPVASGSKTWTWSNPSTWTNPFTWSNPLTWLLVYAAAVWVNQEEGGKPFYPWAPRTYPGQVPRAYPGQVPRAYPGQVPGMTAKPDRPPGYPIQTPSNQSPPQILKKQVDGVHGDVGSATIPAVTELYWAEVYVPFFHFAFIKRPLVAENRELMLDGLLKELDEISQMASQYRYTEADPDLVSLVSFQIDWQRQTLIELTETMAIAEELKNGETLATSEGESTSAPIGETPQQTPISQEQFEKNIKSFSEKLNRYIDDPNVVPESMRPVADRFVRMLYEQDDRLYEATIMQVRMQERYQGRAFDLPPIPAEEEDLDTK